MGTLGQAIALAAQAHDGQKDRDGIDYIHHPLRVMESVRKAGFGEAYLIVAVLHDTIEDTWVTEELITKEFGSIIAEALEGVTRRGFGNQKEVYADFVHRAKQNPISRIVKTHDVLDNLGRNPTPSEHKKYNKAYAILNDIEYKENDG